MKKIDIDLDFKPTEKQLVACQAPERYILYGGAVGGGKTVWLCSEAIDLSFRYAGNAGILCRHRLNDFKNTTLKTLQSLLPAPTVKIKGKEVMIWMHHQTDHYFKFSNKSMIYYGGLGDYEDAKQKLGGLELGWFGVDQAEEITESQFNLLTTRLRLQINGLQYRGFLTANPQPGWLRDRFIDTVLPDHKFIPALPKDNPHLPPDYIDELLKTLPKPLVQQLIEGNWDIDAASNYLIPYSQIREAIRREVKAEGDIIAGVDVARYGPDESVFIARQGNKVIGIESWSKQDEVNSAGFVARYIRKYQPVMTYIDAVGFYGVVDILTKEGLPVNGVNVGELASEPKLYWNKRAEYYSLLAKKFQEEEIDIPDHPLLASQLAGIKYDYRETRLLMRSKEDMRKEGIKSPDYADALMLAFISARKRRGTRMTTYAGGGRERKNIRQRWGN